jgi:L-histidine N-alpha-methyltransferase
MRPGDYFLLGVDLVKQPALLDAAYNDAAGVTAAFTRNLFERMNRELGATIDTSVILHEARYNPARRRVEIGARFERSQAIFVRPLGRRFLVRAGERVETEISRKYELRRMQPYLERFGFALKRVFTDDQDWFATLLLERTATGEVSRRSADD